MDSLYRKICSPKLFSPKPLTFSGSLSETVETALDVVEIPNQGSLQTSSPDLTQSIQKLAFLKLLQGEENGPSGLSLLKQLNRLEVPTTKIGKLWKKTALALGFSDPGISEFEFYSSLGASSPRYGDPDKAHDKTMMGLREAGLIALHLVQPAFTPLPIRSEAFRWFLTDLGKKIVNCENPLQAVSQRFQQFTHQDLLDFISLETHKIQEEKRFRLTVLDKAHQNQLSKALDIQKIKQVLETQPNHQHLSSQLLAETLLYGQQDLILKQLQVEFRGWWDASQKILLRLDATQQMIQTKISSSLSNDEQSPLTILENTFAENAPAIDFLLSRIDHCSKTQFDRSKPFQEIEDRFQADRLLRDDTLTAQIKKLKSHRD
ncbi:MAG: hypothetical protein K2X66_13065 [Cyanobacteria bacterium]|nr:hypothetical protein [Cyanobacteriota bacterium]